MNGVAFSTSAQRWTALFYYNGSLREVTNLTFPYAVEVSSEPVTYGGVLYLVAYSYSGGSFPSSGVGVSVNTTVLQFDGLRVNSTTRVYDGLGVLVDSVGHVVVYNLTNLTDVYSSVYGLNPRFRGLIVYFNSTPYGYLIANESSYLLLGPQGQPSGVEVTVTMLKPGLGAQWTRDFNSVNYLASWGDTLYVSAAGQLSMVDLKSGGTTGSVSARVVELLPTSNGVYAIVNGSGTLYLEAVGGGGLSQVASLPNVNEVLESRVKGSELLVLGNSSQGIYLDSLSLAGGVLGSFRVTSGSTPSSPISVDSYLSFLTSSLRLGSAQAQTQEYMGLYLNVFSWNGTYFIASTAVSSGLTLSAAETEVRGDFYVLFTPFPNSSANGLAGTPFSSYLDVFRLSSSTQVTSSTSTYTSTSTTSTQSSTTTTSSSTSTFTTSSTSTYTSTSTTSTQSSTTTTSSSTSTFTTSSTSSSSVPQSSSTSTKGPPVPIWILFLVGVVIAVVLGVMIYTVSRR